jgi:O-antigen/teichoic acid export membrane protein
MSVLKRLIPQSLYARNVITLMTGTGLAQAIPAAISPILTRLYSPEHFGTFALYMAIVSITSVLVTGRYELAILLPRSDRDALHILALSAGLSCVISALLLLGGSVFHLQITQLLGMPDLAGWLYWGPASTLLMGIYTSLNYWSNRKGHYRRLAVTRVVQTTGSSATQLGAAFLHSGSAGLLAGQLVGQSLSISLLARQIYRDDHVHLKNLRWRRLLVLARRFLDFPRYLIVAHGFNTASGQAPAILFNIFFNTATAGHYMLIQRVMGTPMGLVADALGSVFRQEASQAYSQTGNCRTIYVSTFKRLLALGVLPFGAFFFAAPTIFGWVFGGPWRVAGEYAQILTPMFFLQFITSPLSTMFVIAEKQKMDLAWQICLLVLVVLAISSGGFFNSVKTSLILFSAAYSLMYAVNGLVSYYLSVGRWAK